MPLPPDENPNSGARRGFHPSDPEHAHDDPFAHPAEPAFGPGFRSPGAGTPHPEFNLDTGGTFGSPVTPPEPPSRALPPAAFTPPAASAPPAPAPRRAAHPHPSHDPRPQASTDRRFRGAIARTVGSTIIPGLGLLGTRAHNLGILLVAGVLLGGLGLGFTVARNPALVAGLAVQSGWMKVISTTLALLGLVWVAVIVGTYLISRPRTMTPGQRTFGAVAVGVLSLLVAAPVAVASTYSFETSVISQGVFTSEKQSQSQTRPTLKARDPWADKATLNVLLLGGDSGEGRDADLGIRTDTMMMASIDTKTGNTLIVQLPRNLQYPQFPAGSDLAKVFPYGFDNGSSSMLNAVWNDVPIMYPELFAHTDYPGADALKYAVEGVTGLQVDYFVMINIDGLVNLIDAMGGVRVNVNYPIAKAGSDEDYNCGYAGFIPEGPDQLLNGVDAMWFARSRCNSPNADFSRMQRQSCLVNAVIAQADPTTMATRYEAIAKAAGDMIATDIPQEALPAMVELSMRVQKGNNVQRLAFVHGMDGYYSDYPDFDLMHAQIAAAIEALSTPPAAPAPDPNAGPGQEAPGAGTGAGTNTGSDLPATGTAENITDACAYRHEEPLPGVPIPPDVPVYTPPATEPPR